VANEVFAFSPDPVLDTLDELGEYAGEDGLEDLGHDLLPRLVDAGRAREHRLPGFWRDVGTVSAYWDCHQELLGKEPPIDLDDPAWPIRTRGLAHRSSVRVRRGSEVQDSLLAPGAVVAGNVERSVVGRGGVVEAGAVVRESVLLPGAVVRRGARVERAILDDRVEVCPDAVVGEVDGEIALVGLEAAVEAGTRLPAGVRFPEVEE
jgi:glucose-1-phosphate adenylyltransferase